jgi:hypothetical protein
VHALRNDNFAEDIELALVDPPSGFWLSGAVVPGNADRVQLTLTVPPTPPQGPVVLDMIGRARGKGNGASLTRPAVPAESMMQAFIWNHLIPVEDWSVMVSGKPGPKPPFDIVMTSPRIVLPVGGDVYVPVRPVNKTVNPDELQVTLNEPKGVSAKIVIDVAGAFAIKLTTDAEQVEPGSRGNLLLHAHRMTNPPATRDNPNPKPWRTDFGYFPAIPFEVAKQKSKH